MSHVLIKNNINKLLKERDWKVSQLEKKLGSTRAVTNILRGTSKNPTIEVLNSIAKAFDIEVQELLTDDNEQDPILNTKLICNTCNKIVSELESTGDLATLRYSNFFSIIKDVYEYSMQLGLDEADENYIKFVIHRLKKKPT